MPIETVSIKAGRYAGRVLEFLSTKKGQRVVVTMERSTVSVHVHKESGRWNAMIQQSRRDNCLGSMRMGATFMRTAEAAYKAAAVEAWPEVA